MSKSEKIASQNQFVIDLNGTLVNASYQSLIFRIHGDSENVWVMDKTTAN